jgi:hypothetical protein
MSGEPEYVAEHLRTAFATDRRVHELGLEVSVIGGTIVVRGTVSTAAQRDAVREVDCELAPPQAEVVDDVEVLPNPEPDTAEDLG